VLVVNFSSSLAIAYVQHLSSATFTISPTLIPTEDAIITIVNPSPTLVNVTQSVVFRKGSSAPQTVTLTHLGRPGDMRLTVVGSGGNYEGALWREGVLVKALPQLMLSTSRIIVPYHFDANVSVLATTAQTGPVNITAVFVEAGLGEVRPAVAHMVNGVATFTVVHINPGFTRVRVIATGSNYDKAEVILTVQLNFPGFDLGTDVLHVQRFRGANLQPSLSGPNPGISRVTVTPNEQTDSDVRVNVAISDSSVGEVFSQDGLDNQAPTAEQLKYNTYRADEPKPNSKYFQVEHKGVIGSAQLFFSSSSPRWPTVSGCAQTAVNCSGYSEAIYFGIVQPIPSVLVLTHAGFLVTATFINVQRLNVGTFDFALDTRNSDDVTVYFTSSDTSVVTVQESVTFPRNDPSRRNITVFNRKPGTATISARSVGGGIAYDGAAGERYTAIIMILITSLHVWLSYLFCISITSIFERTSCEILDRKQPG
jgi:hypothetical protein